MCAAQETSAAATAAVRTLTLERDGLLDQRDVLIRIVPLVSYIPRSARSTLGFMFVLHLRLSLARMLYCCTYVVLHVARILYCMFHVAFTMLRIDAARRSAISRTQGNAATAAAHSLAHCLPLQLHLLRMIIKTALEITRITSCRYQTQKRASRCAHKTLFASMQG